MHKQKNVMFGISNEGSGESKIYLTQEKDHTSFGKGPNAVLS
jgi:hypothetical protein